MIETNIPSMGYIPGGELTETEMIIVQHAIAMLNQIGLSGEDADKIIYGNDNE